MSCTLLPASTSRLSSSLTCVVLPLLSMPSSTMNAPRTAGARSFAADMLGLLLARTWGSAEE